MRSRRWGKRPGDEYFLQYSSISLSLLAGRGSERSQTWHVGWSGRAKRWDSLRFIPAYATSNIPDVIPAKAGIQFHALSRLDAA